MNPFSAIASAYVRWRHSRGFGVHSPFAYEMVKSVVSPGNYAYYGYHDIDRVFMEMESPEPRHLRQDAMLTLRLLAFLDAPGLASNHEAEEVFRTVADALGKPLVTFDGTSPRRAGKCLAIIAGESRGEWEAERILGDGIPVIAFDPTATMRKAMTGSIRNGLVLEGTRVIISVPRECMAPTYYTMRF